MAVVWNTSSVAPHERAELWTETTSQMFVPLECRPHDRTGFYAGLRAGTVGPLALSSLEVSPHTVQRTARLAANTPGDQYKLSLLLGGEALVVQDQREAVLRPGDLAIYDCSRPYTVVGSEPFRMLVCMVPQALIGLSPEQIARITATRIAGRDGLGWAMAPFLQRLADLAVREEVPADDHRLVESVVDLVESLCASLVVDDVRPGTSRTELLLRIRAYIDTHLGDADLSPTSIALAHFVSKRYLHKLFQDEGVAVARYIRERRLERCRRDLADAGQREQTVTSIGVRWGLADSAHFSRLFREAYQCTPTQYRQQQLAAG